MQHESKELRQELQAACVDGLEYVKQKEKIAIAKQRYK